MHNSPETTGAFVARKGVEDMLCHVSVFISLPHGSVLVPRLLVGNVVKTLEHRAAWRLNVECLKNYIYPLLPLLTENIGDIGQLGRSCL